MPERLDVRQVALLDQVRSQWADVLMSTEPADRPATEAAVRGAYDLARLPTPGRMIWVSSPLVSLLAVNILAAFDDDPENVGKEHAWWSSLLSRRLLQHASKQLDQVDRDVLGIARGAPVRWGSIEYCFVEWEDAEGEWPSAALSRHTQHQVTAVKGARPTPGLQIERDAVTDEIIDRTLAAVEPLVGALRWQQVCDRWHERIRDLPYRREVKEHVTITSGTSDPYGATRAAAIGLWTPACIGQFQAPRWGFVDFFHRVGVSGLDRLAPLWYGLTACGPYWPLHHVVILTERPTLLSFDADRRLHADHGPAVAYPDGYAVYACHGTLRPPDSPLPAGR